MDIGVAVLLDLTLRRRRSCHAYFPSDEGSARLRPGHARFLSWPLAFVRPHGRVGGRIVRSPGFWGRSFFPFCAARLQPAALRLADLASIASVRTGLTASASIASTASASTASAGINCSSAAGVGAAGAVSPLRRRPSPSLSATARPSSSISASIPVRGDAAAGLSGGCVIHKLNYDSNGKYVGERQIPLC